jgi:chromosome segregation ATPase
MDATPAAAAPRRPKDAKLLLERLGIEGDRFSVKLRALEAHPGYRWLRNQTSAGTTRQVADSVSTTMDDMSEQLRGYRATLEAAAALLNHARVGRDELTSLATLVQGLSDAVPLPSASGRASVLSQLTAAHDRVKEMVIEVDVYATGLQQQLARLGEMLAALQGRVATFAFPDDRASSLIEELTRERALIEPIVLADPLGFGGSALSDDSDSSRGRLRRLTAAVENARAHLNTIGAGQSELRQSISRLRERVERVAVAEQECQRTEAEVQVRIAEPQLAQPEELAKGLRQRLALLDLPQLDGKWYRLQEMLRELDRACDTAEQRAEERHAAARAVMEERDELRGRLESYRAMAIAYQYTEDLALAGVHDRAYQMLWTAPCNLRQAALWVARFQQAVIDRTESRAEREAGR